MSYIVRLTEVIEELIESGNDAASWGEPTMGARNDYAKWLEVCRRARMTIEGYSEKEITGGTG